MKSPVHHEAVVGVAEHGNSAVLVTVAPGAELLDRRRIDLTHGLPTHPYHHAGSWAVGRSLGSAAIVATLAAGAAGAASIRATASVHSD